MQTGTTKANHKQYTLTILLLCFGYFIDFYDLTIFSASYSDIIRDLFNIHATSEIQLLYLKITNYHTAGIICGGIFFGILGDKFGRTTVIRYSILLYSCAINVSCYTHSIEVFTILRFLAGVGLASEFATSSVLISEMLPKHLSSRCTAWLYCCGILGGITATFLGILSWKIMFLFGGGSGFGLYLMRKRLFESPLFLKLNTSIAKGNPWHMFKNITNIIKTFKLALLITPFYFTISIMFILPNFMQLKGSLTSLIHTLLIGFFIGNLFSTLVATYLINVIKDFRPYFVLNSIIFLLTISCYSFVKKDFFLLYALILGLLGGGLPTVWIQVVTKSYGTNHRNTAANTLYVVGRSSSIGFNILIAIWLANPKNFSMYCIITTIIITLSSIFAAITSKNMYIREIDYIE